MPNMVYSFLRRPLRGYNWLSLSRRPFWLVGLNFNLFLLLYLSLLRDKLNFISELLGINRTPEAL
jgi:hypothetical protein